MFSQQNDFLCAACPPTLELPTFTTFKEVREHSLQAHRVSLETAVQSSTLLPDKLAMYLCRLCTTDHREIFLCETMVKNHLETHSAFFLKRWKEFTEMKCRICEDVIEEADLVEHVDKFHPIHMFADINDLENKKLKCSPKSPATQHLHSSPKERKSHSLPNNLSPVAKKTRSWQSSQPASQDDLLWDSCFQPEQLIDKYFRKLAPAARGQEEPFPKVETVTPPTKSHIRVKPLCQLQAQVKPASPTDNGRSSRTAEHSSSKLSRRSPSHPISSHSRSFPRKPRRMRKRSPSPRVSMSPLPTPSKPSSYKQERELPPAKTWWSKNNNDCYKNLNAKNNLSNNNFRTGECLLCGLQVPWSLLAKHSVSEHHDLLFSCKVGRCRTSQKGEFDRSCFLYANQLNDHHKVFHNIKKSNPLDTSKSMTGLPASMVKISCSKCSHFVLFPDTGPMVKHLWSQHRKEDVSLLRYHCRLCSAPFSSVEKVVEHSKDHFSGRSQSRTDSELDQGSTGKINWNRSRAVRSRSPVSNFSQSSESFPEKYSDRQRSTSMGSRVLRAKSKRSPSRKGMRSPSRKRTRSSSRKGMRSPSRKGMRSPSRKSMRSPSRKSMRSPSGKRMRSPSRKSRRSSGRNIFRSPSRMSMRSPNRKCRSPSRMSRRCSGRDTSRSPSRKRTRSTYRNGRSPSGKIRRSPSRIRRSVSRKS